MATGEPYVLGTVVHGPLQTNERFMFKSQKEKDKFLAQNVLRTLPKDASERKTYPITSGVLDYFPLAIAEVARLSKVGNDQHNPGQPLHWDRTKSTDHADCLVRHLIERGTIDKDGISHTTKVAWRALALLQEELEKENGFQV